MMRKLTVVSLVIGLCLMGLTPVFAQKVYPTLAEYEKLTGKKIEKFNEASMLKTKVAAGELPSVEERLPEEPLVIEPLEEIGEYGGTLRTGSTSLTSAYEMSWTREEAPIKLHADLKTIVSGAAKNWELSKDLKTLTLYFRKGMKWSDGVPFTAEDIMFWYNDILLNDELTPVKPKKWSPGEELVKVKKIDDYTLQFQFRVPYPGIIGQLAFNRDFLITPKHYLKQWHIKYNPKADNLAKKEGYDYWWQCFNFHKKEKFGQDVNLPVIFPWVLKKIGTTQRSYERNPYYWKIDTAGNQLPYADKELVTFVGNIAVLDLKTIAGEFDYAGQHTLLANYTLYKEGEKKGDYEVRLWKSTNAAEISFSFNLTHKDPILKKIFNDIRFRQAMSLAINRNEINDILYFGKATPRQATAIPSVSFYEPWMGKYYAEYDPKRATELLDEMGLKWDKNHQYRLRPDGKSLSITMENCQLVGPMTKMCELVKDYWEKVGVKVALKEVQRSFYETRLSANELEVNVWPMQRASEIGMRRVRADNFEPLAVPWMKWRDSNGKAGEEPSEAVKEFFELVDKWMLTPSGTKEYMELGKQILTVNVKNLFRIGTVGMPPWPIIVKNNLKNIPKEAEWGTEARWREYLATQWFFKR